jgi:hypothetical protein
MRRLAAMMVVEHVLIAAKIGIMVLVDDVPQWIRERLARDKMLAEAPQSDALMSRHSSREPIGQDGIADGANRTISPLSLDCALEPQSYGMASDLSEYHASGQRRFSMQSDNFDHQVRPPLSRSRAPPEGRHSPWARRQIMCTSPLPPPPRRSFSGGDPRQRVQRAERF